MDSLGPKLTIVEQGEGARECGVALVGSKVAMVRVVWRSLTEESQCVAISSSQLNSTMAARSGELVEIPASHFRLVVLNKRLCIIEATAKITITREWRYKMVWKVPRDVIHSEVYTLHRHMTITHHHYRGKRYYSCRLLVTGPDPTLVLRAGQAIVACHYAPPDSSSDTSGSDEETSVMSAAAQHEDNLSDHDMNQTD